MSSVNRTARTDIRILLVEDNELDVRSTLRAASRLGIEGLIDVVGDGQVALDHLREPPNGGPRPALVLLDLELPVKNGREVLAEMKADRDLRRIPVVVLTTSKAEADVNGVYDLGASAFVTKPVGLDDWTEVAARIEGFWLDVVRFPTDRR